MTSSGVGNGGIAPSFVLLMATFATLTGPGGAAAEWSVDGDQSLFAVVTHKEGLGARFAHEHLVVARSPRAHLELPEVGEVGGAFELSVTAAELAIDDPVLAARWQDRLLDWGVLAGPFAEISDKDRRKIRDSMLGDDQLAASRFPEIRARATALTPPAEEGGAWSLTLSMTLRGQTVERLLEAEVETREGTFHARVIAALSFTELGIEPYSAMLGAVRVADQMHLVVVLVAERVGGDGETSTAGC